MLEVHRGYSYTNVFSFSVLKKIQRIQLRAIIDRLLQSLDISRLRLHANQVIRVNTCRGRGSSSICIASGCNRRDSIADGCSICNSNDRGVATWGGGYIGIYTPPKISPPNIFIGYLFFIRVTALTG